MFPPESAPKTLSCSLPHPHPHTHQDTVHWERCWWQEHPPWRPQGRWRGAGPLLCTGRAGRGRAGSLPAAPASEESQWGALPPLSRDYPDRVSVGGAPNLRGSGCRHSPGRGGGRLWGNLPLRGQGEQSQAQLPQSGAPRLGPWPPLTTPLPPGAVRSANCCVALRGGGGGGDSGRGWGVHLKPLEPPGKQRCLCVPGRGLPALPRDGWAAGRRLRPHADPAGPAPWNPGPGQ